MDEAKRLPQPDRDRPLDEVIEDFGRRLRPSGPDGEIDEWSIYDESFRRLVSWASESGRFYEGLQALKEGGQDIDLKNQSPPIQQIDRGRPATIQGDLHWIAH